MPEVVAPSASVGCDPGRRMMSLEATRLRGRASVRTGAGIFTVGLLSIPALGGVAYVAAHSISTRPPSQIVVPARAIPGDGHRVDDPGTPLTEVGQPNRGGGPRTIGGPPVAGNGPATTGSTSAPALGQGSTALHGTDAASTTSVAAENPAAHQIGEGATSATTTTTTSPTPASTTSTTSAAPQPSGETGTTVDTGRGRRRGPGG